MKALEMLRNQMLAGAVCVCYEEVEAVYFGARKYLGHNCAAPDPDYVMQERAGAARWVLEHPECVLYEHWFDYLRAQSARVGINLDVRVSECEKVGLDVRVAYQEVCKEVLLEFEVEELKCELDIDITVEELNNCKVDYEFKVKPLNCDITFETFVRAVKCGVDVDTLVREINCGASVKVTAEGIDFCYPDIEVSGNA